MVLHTCMQRHIHQGGSDMLKLVKEELWQLFCKDLSVQQLVYCASPAVATMLYYGTCGTRKTQQDGSGMLIQVEEEFQLACSLQ